MTADGRIGILPRRALKNAAFFALSPRPRAGYTDSAKPGISTGLTSRLTQRPQTLAKIGFALHRAALFGGRLAAAKAVVTLVRRVG
jgi:hypothetical protein